MYKSFLKIAWRNILKNKVFTGINIIGLSLSMSICLLLILLIYDHYAIDNFHIKGDRIHRVVTYKTGSSFLFGESGYASSPLPFNEELKKYSFVEEVCNLKKAFRGEVRSESKILELENGLYASENFFKVFDFQLSSGSPESSLKEPFSAVLTFELANKLFPNKDPLGQTIEFKDHGAYKITGVLEELNGKSHLSFEALASFSSIPLLVSKELMTDDNDNWDNVWSNYNYLVLSDNEFKAELEGHLKTLGDKMIVPKDENDLGYEFELQKITEITPGPLLSNELGYFLPTIALIFFAFLGFIVIITASINFANLSIAQSLTRLKEVGIRKTIGATKTQIVIQFLFESVLLSLVSLIFALIIYRFLIDQFNEIWIFSTIGFELNDIVFAYWIFLSFTVFLGLITGIGPSIFLSNRNVIKSLKGGSSISIPSRNKFLRLFSGKKIMLGVQFGLSIILLMSIFIIKDQAKYLTNSEYGFDEESVYFIDLQSHDKDILSDEFSSIPGVGQFSFTSHHPSVGRSMGAEFQKNLDEEPIHIHHFSVDENYIDVMGLDLIAGNNFPRTSSEDEKFIILNELAVERLGFKTPQEALDQEVIIKDDARVKIIGVVKDYHWETMLSAIKPLALRVIPDNYNFAYFKIEGSELAALDRNIKEKWSSFDTGRDFKGGFLDEEMQKFYRFLYDLGDILTMVSLVALIITSLGFLGMVSFHLKTRIKEFGIRKILGANFKELSLTMSKGFLIMLTITFAVSVPIAIFINSLWINQMATRAPLGFSNLSPAILIVLLITSISIFTLIWKTDRSNPVNALRNE